MKNLLLFGALALCLNSYGQPTHSWAKSFGGISGEFGRSVSVDDSGNVYTTGYFQGTVDFDPGVGIFNLSSNGGTDIFIQKLDANGAFLWAISIGGSSSDQVQSITKDASNNLYITGYYNSTVDFDPGIGVFNLTATGSSDIYILKIDSNGSFVWAKSIGGSGNDDGLSIATDVSGNIYTTGSIEGSVDLDPGPGVFNLTANGSNDCFILKLDSNGSFIWAKRFGGVGSDKGNSITNDLSGNVYTTGYFTQSIDFDTGIGTFNLIANGGGRDCFILKLDSNGSFLWATSMGGDGNDSSRSIAVDLFGNVLTTGEFKGSGDFDPGVGIFNLVGNGGYTDVFIQKLDSSGAFIWAKKIGSGNTDSGSSITTDLSGSIYVTGQFRYVVDFNPGAGTFNLNAGPTSDGFTLKLNTNGSFVWAISMGSNTTADYGVCSILDQVGNIYTTGLFQSPVDFDPGVGTYTLLSNGNSDAFIQKLSQCQSSSSTDTQSACDSYTWVDGNTYTTSNNSATYTTSNAAGCDSTVTLDLTINPTPDNSITQNGASLTATQTGATYQWIDCDNFNAPITGEVNQTFSPSSTGNYAVEVTIGDCSSTSECRLVDFTGIDEIESLISVHPNPTKDEVTLSIGAELLGIGFIVTDNAGRIVLTDTFESTEQNVNLSVFDNGVYFIRTDKESPVKIIKQ